MAERLEEVSMGGGALRVFHGTDEPSDLALVGFRPSAKGTLGSGIYFAGRASEAMEYGNRVYTCDVQLVNPWRVKLDPDSPTCWEWGFDSPALEAVLGLKGGQELALLAQQHEAGHFGIELTTLLKGLGYDGILGDYGSCVEVVAFDPCQIRIVGMRDRSEVEGRIGCCEGVAHG